MMGLEDTMKVYHCTKLIVTVTKHMLVAIIISLLITKTKLGS